MNMSYCRFHNTNIDLQECLDVLRNREYEKVTLSKMEYCACENMFENIINFLIDEGIIEDDGEIFDRLAEMLIDIHWNKSDISKEENYNE